MNIKPVAFLLSALILSAATPAYAVESYIAVEAHTGRVFLASHSEKKRPVASLSKIAMAKVVLDWAQASQTSLAVSAVVPHTAFSFASANPMGIQSGDRITLRDALYSSLMGSDNISAHTLADHVGRALLAHRRLTGDPQKVFVYEMNNLAKALGMRRTKFTNSHGLDLPRRRSYSTASDMARLSMHAMRDPGFRFYVKQKTRTIRIVKSDGKKLSYKVSNTNPLLGQLGVNGIKTGITAAAGECLAVNANRKPLVKKISDQRSQIRYRDLIVIVLGSADRVARSKQLINQSWPMYDQWAASGYLLTNKGRELLRVPELKQ